MLAGQGYRDDSQAVATVRRRLEYLYQCSTSFVADSRQAMDLHPCELRRTIRRRLLPRHRGLALKMNRSLHDARRNALRNPQVLAAAVHTIRNTGNDCLGQRTHFVPQSSPISVQEMASSTSAHHSSPWR
uniref:Transposase n=1 Tax=Ascaris lumbricoides TaxID=6252 RepID=A0A0M3HWL6_ASCLU